MQLCLDGESVMAVFCVLEVIEKCQCHRVQVAGESEGSVAIYK
jgi:hypothetical protein